MYPRVLAAVVLSLLFGALPARATAPAGTLDPLLRAALRARYPGKVAIVGIHSPETPAEHARANVVASLAGQGIVWPVALDRRGRLRKTVVGEGSDGAIDAEIAHLVAER